MALTPSFTWPTGNLSGRSAKGFVQGGTLFVPEWDRHACYSLNLTTGVGSYLSFGITDDFPFYESATGIGFISGDIDSAGNRLLLSADGRLGYRSAGGVAAAYTCVPAAGKMAVQIAYDGTEFIALTTDGGVYKMSSVTGGVQPTFTLLASYGAFVCSLGVYNGFAYGLKAGFSDYGKMAVVGGATTTVTTPMPTPMAIAPSVNGVAVSGYGPSTLAEGYIALQSRTNNEAFFAAGARASTPTVDYLGGSDNAWAVSTSFTTAHQAISIAWTANGGQLLVSEASDTVEVLTLTSGSFVVSQTLTVTGAGAMAVTADNTEALICQASANSLTVLSNSVNIWSIASTVTGVSSPVDVALISTSKAAVASTTAGIIYVTLLGGIWTIASTVALPFAPTSISYDLLSGNLYITGTSAGSGFLAHIDSNGVLHADDTWTGSADNVITFSNRVMVLDKTNSLTRQYPINSFNYTTEVVTFASPVATPVGQFLTNNNIWTSSATASAAQNLLGPNGALVSTRIGSVAVRNETTNTWSTFTLGAEVIPTAIYWDSAANLWVADSSNTITQLTATATHVSSTTIPAYTNQGAGVPLGISSIVRNGTSLYCTSSLSGVIVQISGLT